MGAVDATTIRFKGGQRRGAGSRFECDTRFGPLRLTDVMEVTEWEHGERIGVRHGGVVSGAGSFTLRDVPGQATRVEWEELLVFPWWLGAALGAATRETPLRRRMARKPPPATAPPWTTEPRVEKAGEVVRIAVTGSRGLIGRHALVPHLRVRGARGRVRIVARSG